MHVNSLSSIYTDFIQPVLSKTLGIGSPVAGAVAGNTSATAGDTGQLSPFGQIASTLQQLQQQNPSQYQSVTKQIAANLQTAAQTAQANGQTAQANQLTQLASDFTNASQNNQLPNFQDLTQAIAGGLHRHHHSGASSDSSAGSNTSTAGTSIANLLSKFSAGQNQTADPGSIILNALATSGISLS
jgi:hypothetical protein